MSDRIVPHDNQAEESTLGAMLLSYEAIEGAVGIVESGDFYKPAHGSVFAAIVEMYDDGVAIDAVTVADLLRQRGQLDGVGGPQALATIMASTPSTTNVRRYAEIVARHAHSRRLIGVLAESTAAVYDLADPGEISERTLTALDALGQPGSALPADVSSMDEWLEQEHTAPPWAIPDIIRVGWRIIVVAAEGSGKSVATRQIALSAAQGVHPFHHRDIPAVNTLLIDLENPDEAIRETGDRITKQLRIRRGEHYREHGCWIWHRPAGIDLRSRKDRAEMEAVLAHVQPRLVCLGPLYRAFTRRGREDHEEVAEQVQRALDQMRNRHGFGIIIEHHAPKATLGKRDLVPFGSSLWQRWPDLGLTLERDADVVGALRLGSYRGNRVRAHWPTRLDRAQLYPWAGFWEDGIDPPTDDPEPDPGPGF